jgi:hypothetical protein
MMPLSRGLSSGRTLARGHREACWGAQIWSFHPHDSTKTLYNLANHRHLRRLCGEKREARFGRDYYRRRCWRVRRCTHQLWHSVDRG